MAQGPQVLHDHVASRMEKAVGRALPQMEVLQGRLNLSRYRRQGRDRHQGRAAHAHQRTHEERPKYGRQEAHGQEADPQERQ
ncbi:hypothetical protein JG688_00015962, partial [Phytophthora aleatoria]